MAPKNGTDWSVRIHRTYEMLEPWILNLSNKCNKLIVYQHDADDDVSRTHCHIVIIGYTTSDATLKAQVIKCLGSRPEKTDWVWDPSVRSEALSIQYLSKKDLKPVYNKGFEESFIAENSAKYVPKDKSDDKNVLKKFKLISETPAQAKKRKNDYIEEMINDLKDNHPMWRHTEGFKYTWNAQEVLFTIASVLNRNQVIYDRYKAREYYDTLMSRILPFHFIDRLKSSIVGFVTKDNSFI